MTTRAVVFLLLSAATVAGPSQASPGPRPAALPAAIEAPRDQPFPGTLTVAVDAADVERRVVHVSEVLDGVRGEVTVLYPRWIPGDHAPNGHVDRLAGLQFSVNGRTLTWTRDALDVHAFHVRLPAGATRLDIRFDYLAPTSDKVGGEELSRDLLILQWPSVVLYPAGYFMRQIPVTASVTLPAGFDFGTALEAQATGSPLQFRATTLETLLDSPIYAGRHAAHLDLGQSGGAPVRLDVFGDSDAAVQIKPEGLTAYRALVTQAERLFASHHYAHYDFLYSLSDAVEQNGTEHHQSSENGADPEAFKDWAKFAWERDLLPHEYVHSWNGKFRRPADLWTPNLNVPMRNSLLWVYEGQTQYWGNVLAARAGLRTRQEALDDLALVAAAYQAQTGRQWRPLQDTVSDEIINPRRPMSWRDYSRFEDYYSEGALLWLEVDTLIRERSNNAHSLDDFARRFFGMNDGSATVVPYTFEDVVRGLNEVLPYDWRGFLRTHLDAPGAPPFLEGVTRGGYRLVYTDQPTEYQKSRSTARKRDSFWFSVGLELASDGTVAGVLWDGPAFKAKITESMKVLAVNGGDYSADALRDAIGAAKDGKAPLQLIVHAGERYSVIDLDYRGGLRYPHLERDLAVPARLDEIYAPRP